MRQPCVSVWSNPSLPGCLLGAGIYLGSWSGHVQNKRLISKNPNLPKGCTYFYIDGCNTVNAVLRIRSHPKPFGRLQIRNICRYRIRIWIWPLWEENLYNFCKFFFQMVQFVFEYILVHMVQFHYKIFKSGRSPIMYTQNFPIILLAWLRW